MGTRTELIAGVALLAAAMSLDFMDNLLEGDLWALLMYGAATAGLVVAAHGLRDPVTPERRKRVARGFAVVPYALAARLVEAWLAGSFATGQLVFVLWILASAVLAAGAARWARGEAEARWRPTTRRGTRLLALAFGLFLILTTQVALGGNVGPSVLGSLAEWTLGLAGALLVLRGLDGLSTPAPGTGGR